MWKWETKEIMVPEATRDDEAWGRVEALLEALHWEHYPPM